MVIKTQLFHPNAVLPFQSREGDACWDLISVSKTVRRQPGIIYIEYGTGVAVEIPEDHVGLIFQRSSVSNYNLQLANAVGVIDPQYRGEIKLRYKYDTNVQLDLFSQDRGIIEYNVGEKVGQILIISRPFLEFVQVESLSLTNRGDGGFGSSGK